MPAKLLLTNFIMFVSFASLGACTSVSSVSLAFVHVCASSTRGEVKCWGQESRLGIGYDRELAYYKGDRPGEMGPFLPAVNLGTNRTVKELAHGLSGGHSCAILENNDLKCWGFSLTGALGGTTGIVGSFSEMGDNLDIVNLGTNRSATQVAIGKTHTCAVLDNGDLKCWGDALEGKLGVGFMPYLNQLGDVQEEMGDALLPINLGAGRTALQVSCGQQHTCALLDNHQVKCWGQGLYGQLGNGRNINVGEAASDMGDNLLPVALGENRSAVQVGCGSAHTCVLLDNHQVKCWGTGLRGGLGNGGTDTIGNDSNQMGDNLTDVELGRNLSVTRISVGLSHTCALFTNHKIKCFGSGVFGAMGQENKNDVGDEPNEMGDNLPFIDLGTNRSVVHIESGFARSCASLDDGTLKCWGYNTFGLLGLGDSFHRGTLPNTMGDHLPIVDLAFGQPLPTPAPVFAPTSNPVSPTQPPTFYPSSPPVEPSPFNGLSFGIGVGTCSIIAVLVVVALKLKQSKEPIVTNSRNSLQPNNVRYQGGGSGRGGLSPSSPVAIAVAKRENGKIPVATVISP